MICVPGTPGLGGSLATLPLSQEHSVLSTLLASIAHCHLGLRSTWAAAEPQRLPGLKYWPRMVTGLGLPLGLKLGSCNQLREIGRGQGDALADQPVTRWAQPP